MGLFAGAETAPTGWCSSPGASACGEEPWQGSTEPLRGLPLSCAGLLGLRWAAKGLSCCSSLSRVGRWPGVSTAGGLSGTDAPWNTLSQV